MAADASRTIEEALAHALALPEWSARVALPTNVDIHVLDREPRPSRAGTRDGSRD